MSAADCMPYTPPFPTQPFRSSATSHAELKIAIPPEGHAVSRLAQDLSQTLNVPYAQHYTAPIHAETTGNVNAGFVPEDGTPIASQTAPYYAFSAHLGLDMYGALKPVPDSAAPVSDNATLGEADRIFQFFWKFVYEKLRKSGAFTAPSGAPKPPWERSTRIHLQKTALLLARRGMNVQHVEHKFRALLADIRSDSLWLCIKRGIGRDAAPFAVGSISASLIATLIGPYVGSVLAGKLAMHVVSGFVIMLTNTVGAALFDTAWPSLREKLSQTTPALGLEHLNSALHAQLREFVVSCASYAGVYGLIRNPLRLLIESQIPGVMAGPWKDIVHATLELVLAMVGVPLRGSLDHWRMPKNDAAMELLVQANLADLLTDEADDSTQNASFFTAFRERFSKIFCSKTTGLLGTVLTFAFAGIEWSDDVTARAKTIDGERALLNQLDFAYLYAAIGGLLQVALSEARSNDIKTAYLRRAPDRSEQANDVEQGEYAAAAITQEPSRISTGSHDSGIQCFQCELQSAARRDGNWPPQGSQQRSSVSSGSVFESPSATPPDTPLAVPLSNLPPLPIPDTFARIRRPSLVLAQLVQPAFETVAPMPDALGGDHGSASRPC
ncbi:hypothetical protein AT302_18645 [Pandoraea norimbergensis]|uniref:Uncharacterized protein n=2 Tax=Pandoraea norimbergensis TaxID=93219 RepID=A0ABN4JKI4_9BURK|nr:hypothetical protein AT302_18645 [Pandoraea norimbergensis]